MADRSPNSGILLEKEKSLITVFQKTLTADTLKPGLVRERVNLAVSCFNDPGYERL